MKKIYYYFGLVIFLYSCSPSIPSSIDLEVMQTIQGPLNNNLEMVSKTATFNVELDDRGTAVVMFSVEVKVKTSLNIKGGYAHGSPIGPILEYKLFNEKKQPIKIDGFRIQSDPDLSGLASNIGMQDNVFWIQIFQSFAFETQRDRDDLVVKMKERVSKAKYVQLTSRIVK